VGTLLDGERLPGGPHEIRFDRGELPAGVYFYRLEAGRIRRSGKMIVTG